MIAPEIDPALREKLVHFKDDELLFALAFEKSDYSPQSQSLLEALLKERGLSLHKAVISFREKRVHGLDGQGKCKHCGAEVVLPNQALVTSRYRCWKCKSVQTIDYKDVIYTLKIAAQKADEKRTEEEETISLGFDVLKEPEITHPDDPNRVIRPDPDRDEVRLVGLKGWLWLPRLGFYFGIPAAILTAITSLVHGEFVQAGFFLAFLAVDVYMAYLFFRRKRLFPGIAMTQLVVSTAIAMIFSTLDGLNIAFESYSSLPLVHIVFSLAWSAIGVSYLRLSKRVKLTFVNE
jgi:hypothetical protein